MDEREHEIAIAEARLETAIELQDLCGAEVVKRIQFYQRELRRIIMTPLEDWSRSNG